MILLHTQTVITLGVYMVRVGLGFFYPTQKFSGLNW